MKKIYMGKEVGKQHDQRTLSQIMRELEAVNDKAGGTLFSTFGEGNKRAFLFPTHLTRQEGEVTVDELLVVTNVGYRVIQIDRGQNGIDVKSISDIVAGSLGSEYGLSVSGSAGYVDGQLTLGGLLYISPKGTSDFRGTNIFNRFGRRTRFHTSCRLIEVDEVRAGEILNANIKRVEALCVASRMASGVLSKAN